MARPKGFKLSAEQKRKMLEGRMKRKEKAQEGIVADRKIEKVKKDPVTIIGFIKDDGDGVLPVFPSEKEFYKGKIFKTAQEAKGIKK